MNKIDNISCGFSITISSLVALPIILLIGYISMTQDWKYQLVFLIIGIGFYIPSMILYLTGTTSGNNTAHIKTGFGLGLASWILILLLAILTVAAAITDESIPLETVILLYMTYGTVPIGPGNSIPTWISIIAISTIISTIIAIIFGSIVLARRRN